MEPEENIVLVFKYAITLIYVDRGGKKNMNIFSGQSTSVWHSVK